MKFCFSCLGSVWNNSPVGTYVLTVVARDEDVDENAKVRYRMIVPSDKFVLDESSGIITTRTALSSFSGTVSMTIKVFNTIPMQYPPTKEQERLLTVEVLITVSTIKPPVFTERVFSGSVKEDAKTGTSILNVSANSDPPGNTILYSSLLNQATLSAFIIDTITGVIMKKTEVDYEYQKKYIEQVEARDSQTNLVSTTFVEVTVEDVNDDSPTFILDRFEGRVSENAPIGTSVLTVRANDQDTGKSGEITYFLDPKKESSKYFEVAGNTGKITTKISFDREAQGYYILHVFAHDNGLPQLHDECFVLILIIDVNDNPPLLEKQEYHAKIPENATVWSSVIRVLATDLDVADKIPMKYFISAGDDQGMFYMESVIDKQNQTGLMLLERSLDFEYQQRYQLQISASDGRDSDSARVIIEVSTELN